MSCRRILRLPPASLVIALATALSLTSGCALFNGFLDPTKVGAFPIGTREVGIRRVLTAHDTPTRRQNSSDPTPDDLKPDLEDVRIGPSDQLSIVIDDLLREGSQEVANLLVAPNGFIRLPMLGSVKVTGLTEAELEGELKAQLKQAGILPDPQVRVLVIRSNQRTFSILGAVGRAGQYPIIDPDLRLLEAIGQASDIGAEVKRLYIIRRPDGATSASQPGEAPATGENGLVIPPPTEPDSDSEYANFSAFGGSGAGPQESRPAASRKAAARGQEQEQKPDKEVEELMELLGPRRQEEKPRRDVKKASDKPFAPLIYDPDTKQIRETPAEEEAPVEEMPAEEPDQPKNEFDWNKLPDEGQAQRVIAIDVAALRAGDVRYNVVVRNRDVIEVPVDAGVFYLMGEINRPGVYGFGNREITIKQAVALGAGFSQLAWPARCEIIRREPGTDKQIIISVNLDAIFAGLESDVLLRDEDIVNVGSDVVAPFLFVIRNSFRFTYGFGFVYDRNFADRDSYSVQANPTDLARQRRQQRGLPF